MFLFQRSITRRTTGAQGSGGSGLYKTGIRGIQDTRQIVDGKTNDIDNNDKKDGARFINIRQLRKKAKGL